MSAEASASVWPSDSGLLRSSRTSGARSRPLPNWLRLALRQGIEAALKADGDRFTRVRARTALGQVVQGLVNDAQRGKVTAIRLMVSLFDQGDAPGDGTQPATFPGAGKKAGKIEKNGGTEHTQNAGGTPAVPGEENLTQWDWSDAGEWNFAESEQESPPPAQTGYEAAARRWEETQRNLHEMVDRFFERTNEIRARLEAEPPGSAVRSAQWRASAEALRESGSRFGEPLLTKLLRIADNELAKEERFAALEASGDPRFQTQAEEERARRTRWPKIMWIAFLGFGTRLDNAGVDPKPGEDSQGNTTTTEAPDTG